MSGESHAAQESWSERAFQRESCAKAVYLVTLAQSGGKETLCFVAHTTE